MTRPFIWDWSQLWNRDINNSLFQKNENIGVPTSKIIFLISTLDLNRNYDVIGYGIGASENPCSESYKGRLT